MEEAQFASLSAEETVGRLRVHGRLMTGYALALAARAGLDPVEAAGFFVSPLLAGAPADDHGSIWPWLEVEAAAIEAIHGAARLERAGEVGTIVVPVREDLSWLEPWGVPAAFWVAWLQGHVEMVAARHGIAATVRLEGEEIRVRFAPE